MDRLCRMQHACGMRKISKTLMRKLYGKIYVIAIEGILKFGGRVWTALMIGPGEQENEPTWCI